MGLGRVAAVVVSLGLALAVRAADVPLALWKNASFPSGLPMGGTMGVSWGDYNADGYIDLFACFSGSLWRNNAGVNWEFAGNLSTLVPPTERRYGSSFGDFDSDGFPDIAMAPRVPAWGDDRFHLLKNLRTYPYFADVAADPLVIDQQPYGNAETLCWADVDGDADLDLFIPVYPAPLGPGNFFLHNQGGWFMESSAAAGLDVPAGRSRPEGAQFADVDFDGDPDLFSNGTLYQNVSTLSTPRFIALDETTSGIGLAAFKDEGAMLFDYDLDGDQDLVLAYVVEGVRIWENAGDGTFFAAEPGVIDDPLSGLGLGMSAEDWDGDGDVDFTTRSVFRQNRMIEDGARHFTVQTTPSIPSWQLLNATPAWGDWDRDGDLDCALGNWGYNGHLYQNTTYSTVTPFAARRTVRVRVVRDSATVPAGLETEYGATAEVRIVGTPDSYRRRKFVASSHGYLNQNEYNLTFGLSPLPAQASPGEDLRFDLSVDFPGLPSNGLWRIDKHVNPVLQSIPLDALPAREVQVSRCGAVRMNGITYPPRPLVSPYLTTTGGGLALPADRETFPETVETLPDGWIGLAFDTRGAVGQVQLEEIVLDAQLSAAEACAQEAFNVALWDVTDPLEPLRVNGGAFRLQTSSRNRRSYLPIALTLDPGRAYRIIAHVSQYRRSTIGGSLPPSPITVLGGLAFKDVNPCTGQKLARATADPAQTAIALRFRALPASLALDPIGPSLRLGKESNGQERLMWTDIGAPAYRVRRCDARSGACAPEPHALAADNSHVEGNELAIPSLPGENYWYLVDAINECEAGR